VQVSVSFRPLRRADFPLLQKWLGAAHVAVWWGEPLDLTAVNEKYNPLIDGIDHTHVFVMERGGQPFGWIQWYLWSDYPEHAVQLGAEPFSAGIDLAIGELGMMGLGLGPVAICEFLRKIVLVETGVDAVIVDPAEANFRSVRAFEKAGFTGTNKVQLDTETFKRLVMRVNRGWLERDSQVPAHG
jgi:aminoglycoside 6'-N-acetyltransferase